MPKVSVIIPFYNRAKWTNEAIQSVLDQTFQAFEIILIDDGSAETIDPELIGNPHIRYFRQENHGPAAARNRGIDLAQGDYLAFLDADDLFLPTKLEKQIALMEEDPSISFSHTSYQQITSEGSYIADISSGTFTGKVYPKLLLDCPIATPTVMLRRSILSDGLRFDESLRFGEDILLWVQLLRRYPLAGINEPLSKVRIHGKNASLNLAAQIESDLNLIKFLINSSDLSEITKRRLLSAKFYRTSDLYLQTHDRSRSDKNLLKAISAWPLNFKAYKRLVRSLIFLLYTHFLNLAKS